MGEHLKATIFNRASFPEIMTPKEAAIETLISEDRLIQYAKSGYAPCLIIDDTTIMFFKKDLMEWVKKVVCKIQMPQQIDSSVRIIVNKEASFHSIPESLLAMNGKLKTFDTVEGVPVIYFLIQNDEVVYVGQSSNLTLRVATHRDQKEFDRVLYFFHPQDLLNHTEAALIRYLKPKYNIAQSASEANDGHFSALKQLGFNKIEVAI